MKKALIGILIVIVVVIAGLSVYGYKKKIRTGPPVATNEKGEITPDLKKQFDTIAATPSIIHSGQPVEIAPPLSQVQWIPEHGGAKPPNALSAGEELVDYLQYTPRTLYVCRVAQGNGIHPGKLVGGACNVGFAGKEIEVKDYEVAAYFGGSWGNHGLNGALVGGFENNQKLYVCRHHLTQTNYPCFFCDKTDFGWHAGKFLPNTGECHFGYGGKELSDNGDNEFFYP